MGNKLFFVFLLVFLFCGFGFASSASNVLYDWSWSGVSVDACDVSNEKAVFCDSAQFTISLLKKLDSVSAGSSFEFDAFLMGDGFSQDFRSDFDYYYSNVSFFDSPDFYINEISGLRNYFASSDLFIFKLNNSPWVDGSKLVPGKYKVTVDVPWDFNPSVIGVEPVVVNFKFISPPNEESSLLFLPFDGEIGFFGGNKDRKGYGVVFSSNGELSLNDKIIFDNTVSGGVVKVSDFVFVDAFVELNDFYKKKQLLKIVDNGGDFSFEFSSSVPTPIFLEVNKNSNEEEFSIFYGVFNEAGESISLNRDYFLVWDSVSKKCADLSGVNMVDKFVDFFDRFAENEGGDNIDLFAVDWEKSSVEGKSLIESIVYRNGEQDKFYLNLFNSGENISSVFYSPADSGEKIFLNGSGNSLVDSKSKSLFDLLKLVEKGFVEVVVEKNSTIFQWNEVALRNLLSDKRDDFEAECIPAEDDSEEVGSGGGEKYFVLTNDKLIPSVSVSSLPQFDGEGVDFELVYSEIDGAVVPSGYFVLTGEGKVKAIGDANSQLVFLLNSASVESSESNPSSSSGDFFSGLIDFFSNIFNAIFNFFSNLFSGGSAGNVVAVDIELTPSGNGIYLLFKDGSIKVAGDAIAFEGSVVKNAVDLELIIQNDSLVGYHVLDSGGVVYGVMSKSQLPQESVVAPDFETAVDLESTEEGYFVLFSRGTIKQIGGSTLNVVVDGEVVDLEIIDGTFYVLDSYGTIHSMGAAELIPNQEAHIFGTRKARDLEFVGNVDAVVQSDLCDYYGGTIFDGFCFADIERVADKRNDNGLFKDVLISGVSLEIFYPQSMPVDSEFKLDFVVKNDLKDELNFTIHKITANYSNPETVLENSVLIHGNDSSKFSLIANSGEKESLDFSIVIYYSLEAGEVELSNQILLINRVIVYDSTLPVLNCGEKKYNLDTGFCDNGVFFPTGLLSCFEDSECADVGGECISNVCYNRFGIFKDKLTRGYSVQAIPFYVYLPNEEIIVAQEDAEKSIASVSDELTSWWGKEKKYWGYEGDFDIDWVPQNACSFSLDELTSELRKMNTFKDDFIPFIKAKCGEEGHDITFISFYWSIGPPNYDDIRLAEYREEWKRIDGDRRASGVNMGDFFIGRSNFLTVLHETLHSFGENDLYIHDQISASGYAQFYHLNNCYLYGVNNNPSDYWDSDNEKPHLCPLEATAIRLIEGGEDNGSVCGNSVCEEGENEENCAEDCGISFGANKKDMSKYSEKEVFLISDSDWRSVLSLVPVTTWTKQKEDDSICQEGYGTADDVCVYPTLIYHDETDEGRGFDVDSILYFLEQYTANKVFLIGETPIELQGHLISTLSEINGQSQNVIETENIKPISSVDYFSFWDTFDTVVYVENDYGLALMASTYSSLINAPLIIKGGSLDSPNVFVGRNVVLVGNVPCPEGAICSPENTFTNLASLQQKYVDETNTDKIILVNPNDLDIKVEEEFETEKGGIVHKIYSKTSLAAPILASAKHEVIINNSINTALLSEPACEKNPLILGVFNSVNNSLKLKYFELFSTIPEYLTIFSIPGVIPDSKLDNCSYSYQHRIVLDLEYGKINDETYLNTGRIYGITSSDVSSYIARSLNYNSSINGVTIASSDSYDYPPVQSAIKVNELAEDSGFDSSCYSQFKLSSLINLQVNETENLFVYPDKKEDSYVSYKLSEDQTTFERKPLYSLSEIEVYVHGWFNNNLIYSMGNEIYSYNLDNDTILKIGSVDLMGSAGYGIESLPQNSMIYNGILYYLTYSHTPYKSEVRSFNLTTGEDKAILFFEKFQNFLSGKENMLLVGLQDSSEVIVYNLDSLQEIGRVYMESLSGEYINYSIVVDSTHILIDTDVATYIYNTQNSELTEFQERIAFFGDAPIIHSGFIYSTDYTSTEEDIVRYNISSGTKETVISKEGRQANPTIVADWLIYYDAGDFSLLNLVTGDELTMPYSDAYCNFQNIYDLTLNEEYKFMSFNGHGSTTSWYRSLNTNNIPYLNNSYSFAMACLTNNFWQGQENTFSVNFLRKGGIGYHGGVGTVNMGSAYCGKQAFKNLFTGQARSLGAVANSIREDPKDCKQYDMHFVLLGDPTLNILSGGTP